jgi:hypothetical protein
MKNRNEFIPTFDAKLIVFPKNKNFEILNNIIWRTKRVCMQKIISLYAETYLEKKYQ